MAACFFCHKELPFEGKTSFHELCPSCGMDVHVCKNCKFYDPGRSNHCSEPMAEFVPDAEARNFCEYFVLYVGVRAGDSKIDDAKAALEKLFKK